MPLSALLLVLLSVSLHAGWNLFAHARHTDHSLFLRSSIVAGGVGLLLEAIICLQGGPTFSPFVFAMLALTGVFQGLYFLGLTRGYATGAFAVIYPVARGLPVFFLALVDVMRGRIPSLIGWLGMGLVVIGCLLAPLDSWRSAQLRHYWNKSILWVCVTALGTVGYTTVDKIAAEQLVMGGQVAAARYALLEAASTAFYLAILLSLIGGIKTPLFGKNAPSLWRRAAMTAIGIFSAYWLILWAYQLTPFASYIVALRQLSIVIGVAVSMYVLHVPTPRIRALGALIITAGCIAIVLGA